MRPFFNVFPDTSGHLGRDAFLRVVVSKSIIDQRFFFKVLNGTEMNVHNFLLWQLV